MECTLAEIASAQCLERPLRGPKTNSGSITLSAEELSSCKDDVTMQWIGKKLDKKDFFGKSDPFLLFHKSNEDGTFTVVHKTEVIKKTVNPKWKPFKVSARALCNGDYDRLLKIECYDWDKNGKHDLIGVFSTSLKELSQGPGTKNTYECINPKKQAKKGRKYKHSGICELVACTVEQCYSFLHFVRGGTQINCTFAIDFTASNSSPTSSSSLHYMNQYQPNQYIQAVRSVGAIIQDYDSDRLFPALGFGAKMADGRVSHEFFLNSRSTNPYCAGVEGVVSAYSSILTSVQLSGPTNFAPCINHVAKLAAQHQNGDNYFVLLIITDGVISDMPQTTEAIVNASSLPLSIIIVGVGNADFEAMDVLDGDDARLSYRGKYAERDIVQFVPMRDFLASGSHDHAHVQAALAKEVLAEIPEQFLSYMKKMGIKPKPVGVLERQPTAPPMPATAAC